MVWAGAQEAEVVFTGRGLARGRKWLHAGSSRSSNGRARSFQERPFGGSWRLGTAASATAAAAAGEGTAALGLTAGTAQVGAIPGEDPVGSFSTYLSPGPRSAMC